MEELTNNITNDINSALDLFKKISEKLIKLNKHYKKQHKRLEKMDKRNDKQDERFEMENQILHKKLEEISTREQSNVGINKVRQAIWHSIHLSFP